MEDGSGNAQSVPYLATIHSTRSLSRVLFPEVGFGLIDTFLSRLDPLRLPARDPQGTKWTLPMNLHLSITCSLVFAQEPEGPVSLGWVPEKLIRIVGFERKG